MVYKCPRCNGDLTSRPDNRINCEKCGTYSYDFVDGYWQGKTAESAEPAVHADNTGSLKLLGDMKVIVNDPEISSPNKLIRLDAMIDKYMAQLQASRRRAGA
jgi:hypothetical protein